MHEENKYDFKYSLPEDDKIFDALDPADPKKKLKNPYERMFKALDDTQKAKIKCMLKNKDPDDPEEDIEKKKALEFERYPMHQYQMILTPKPGGKGKSDKDARRKLNA